MHTSGIDINSWVTLDASCRMESEVIGDELQIEFAGGALGLVVTEDAIACLIDVLTTAREEFRKMDEDAMADADAEPNGENAA